MANWNLPTINSGYINFVDEMNAKFSDAAVMFGSGGPINFPVGTMRFNRSINIFDEWDGAVFQPKVIGITGGGTGSNNVGGIRTNLGLGSMSTQNSNAVAITGGSITGVAFSASDITGGVIALARGGTGSSLSIATPGTILMSNGAVVYFDYGINIAQLNASSLVAGTVPAARLSGVGILAAENTWLATNTYKYPVTINSDWNSAVAFYNVNGPIDGKKYHVYVDASGDFQIIRVNDPITGGFPGLRVAMDSTLYGNGAGLSNLGGANISFGTINPARMGAGAANASTFLRGDGQWAAVSGGAAPTPIPSGMIAIFTTGCPAGWTRQSALDNRFPMGSSGWGSSGGTTSHYHDVAITTDNSGNHTHGVSGDTGNSIGPSALYTVGQGTVLEGSQVGHRHNFNRTSDGGGAHTHAVNGRTGTENFYPPYLTVVFCQKD